MCFPTPSSVFSQCAIPLIMVWFPTLNFLVCTKFSVLSLFRPQPFQQETARAVWTCSFTHFSYFKDQLQNSSFTFITSHINNTSPHFSPLFSLLISLCIMHIVFGRVMGLFPLIPYKALNPVPDQSDGWQELV